MVGANLVFACFRSDHKDQGDHKDRPYMGMKNDRKNHRIFRP